MRDAFGAFCSDSVRLEARRDGALSGLAFAAKDVFDVEGRVAGAGSPDWKRSHSQPARNAPAVELLLEQGATMIGCTHTDELMFGLNGENYHYGTPINPVAERHIPGGSSSGSAVAVAAGLADFAIGTDTGGSVRIPSSYCGIYGFRPTHGAVSTEGVVPLAPLFDTVGWMARRPEVLTKAGAALLGEAVPEEGSLFDRLLLANDMMALADESCQDALAPQIDRIVSFTRDYRRITVAEEGLDEWHGIFRTLQGRDIWKTHREWIRREQPRFGPGTEERFLWSGTLEHHDGDELMRAKRRIAERLRDWLGEDGVILAPTSPGAPPLRNTRGQEMENRRHRTLLLSCVAGLAGLPQATLPFFARDGMPYGLSFIAGPGQDLRLLKWVETVVHRLGQDNKKLREE